MITPSPSPFSILQLVKPLPLIYLQLEESLRRVREESPRIFHYRERAHGWRGSRGGAVVAALASHSCGLGSNPGPGAICGLSLLLALSLLRRRGFSPDTLVFPCLQKPTFLNSTEFDLECADTYKRVPQSSKLRCYVGK